MKAIKTVTLVTSLVLALATGSVSHAADIASVPSDTAASETAPQANMERQVAPIVGGWAINQGDVSPKKNKAAMKAFKAATKDLVGYDYKVISVLGSQVVAGMNYSYLCQGKVVSPEAHTEYLIVNVYEDLQGNAEITGTGQLIAGASDRLPGGWFYNEGKSDLKKNPEVKAAFAKSVEGFTGFTIEPIAFVGSQVVAGTNYAVVASITPRVANGQRQFGLIAINQDLQGNAHFLQAVALPIGLN